MPVSMVKSTEMTGLDLGQYQMVNVIGLQHQHRKGPGQSGPNCRPLTLPQRATG